MNKIFLLSFVLISIFIVILYKILLYIQYTDVLEPNIYDMTKKYTLLLNHQDKEINLIIGDSRSTYLNTKYLSNKTNTFFFNNSIGGNNYINNYFIVKRIIESNLNIKHIYLQELSSKHNRLNDKYYKKSSIFLLNYENRKDIYSNLNYSYFDSIKNEMKLFGCKYLDIQLESYLILLNHELANRDKLDKYFYSYENKYYGYNTYVFNDRLILGANKELLKYKSDHIFDIYKNKTIKMLEDNKISYSMFKSPVINNDKVSTDEQLVIKESQSFDYVHITHKNHKQYNEWFLEKKIFLN